MYIFASNSDRSPEISYKKRGQQKYDFTKKLYELITGSEVRMTYFTSPFNFNSLVLTKTEDFYKK